MAAAKYLLVFCYLLITILLEVGDVDGRRGGGGSRSSIGSRRSSFSRSSSISRSRSYSNVALSGRIMTGSSIYTGSTWRMAATAGLIYGGLSYTRRYPHAHTMPPICTNNYEKSPEGKVYGYFICPRENETDGYIYCCGAERREYCCSYDMAQEYFSRYHGKSSGLSVGAICGIVLALVVIIAAFIFCCKKRKQAGIIIRKFSKRDGKRNPDYGAQAVPLNGQARPFDGSSGPMPPSYDAVTQPGFDGSAGLPYGPPQPQPPSLDDTKTGLPPDLGGAPQPYWTPYPPANGDFNYTHPGGAPYPPPSDAPYPASGDAPYPTPSCAPYPPSDGASFPPTSGDVPYPPPYGTPYPPAEGAPYPPSSGAPYPSMEGTASYPTSSTIASAPPDPKNN